MDSCEYKLMGLEVIYDHLSSGNPKFGITACGYTL